MPGEEKKKLLIAEDEQQIRSVIRKECERLGIVVFEADNGEDALAVALKEHPGVILLDILMPKMHGIETLRKLRQDAWGKKAEVILLTNFADDPKVLEAVKEGNCLLLNKSETKMEALLGLIKKRIV